MSGDKTKRKPGVVVVPDDGGGAEPAPPSLVTKQIALLRVDGGVRL